MKINLKGDLDVGEHPNGKHFCVSEKGSTFLSLTLMWSSSTLSESPPLLSWSTFLDGILSLTSSTMSDEIRTSEEIVFGVGATFLDAI